MERKLMDAVCQQVYKKFPEVNGVKPSSSARPDDQTLLVFKGTAATGDGRTIQRVIRVVVDSSGKILKMTTSH